jgi:C-terminal processing protease CtpA/Prc
LEPGKGTLGYKSRETKQVTFGQTMSYIPAKGRLTTPLYILIDKGTASAAEALTFVLQSHKRATVMGESSAGGAHFSDYFTINDYIRVSVSTGTPVSAVTQTNWERVGVQPDVKVNPDQALDLAHLAALRKVGHPDAINEETIRKLKSKLEHKK